MRAIYEEGEDGKMHPRPSKFIVDEEGHYWESRGVFGGRTLLAPAPVWAGNINPYLFEEPNIIIKAHRKPLCNVPELRRGSDPVDGGNLLLTGKPPHA